MKNVFAFLEIYATSSENLPQEDVPIQRPVHSTSFSGRGEAIVRTLVEHYSFKISCSQDSSLHWLANS